jgi:hypothetical protein
MCWELNKIKDPYSETPHYFTHINDIIFCLQQRALLTMAPHTKTTHQQIFDYNVILMLKGCFLLLLLLLMMLDFVFCVE